MFFSPAELFIFPVVGVGTSLTRIQIKTQVKDSRYMQISETLIAKFLAGRATKAEAALIARYLRKNPEAWKKYLIDGWDETGDDAELPLNYKELMLAEIRKKTLSGKSRGKTYLRLGLRVATAAASVMLVYWGFRQFNPEHVKTEKLTVSALPTPEPAKLAKTDEAGLEWRVSANRTEQKLKLKLEDGSVVTLLPGSSIRYARHFSNNSTLKRDVYLQGQAFFDVTKNKIRPFVVFAGNMSTTVLGTSFSVQENETGVLVKLYSGKVMVHSVKHSSWNKDVFLQPGEQLRYDTDATLATVTHFALDKPLQKAASAASGEDSLGMVFDNTALPDVMTKLIAHYHTTVVFDKTELSNMFFSGQVLESDSLAVILKVIANMNGLQITQTTDGFMVHRNKE